MSYLTGLQEKQIKEKLVTDASSLGKLYKAKKSKYHEKSVDHSLVDEMVKDGWEEFGKPLKTKTRLRKTKKHSRQFEDDVWCQLYELGYRHLNFDENFLLPYGNAAFQTKQIDVIAIDKDSIILVECKSSEVLKKAPSLKDELEGLGERMGGFLRSLQQVFGNERKIKYVLATRNLRIDPKSVDIQRLLSNKGFFHNDNSFDYVNSLIKNYKKAAKFQFLALLYRGQAISKKKIEIPAIEGRMGEGKRPYYMFSIEPGLLLKMGFVLHRTRANESEMPTYQRLLVPSRLKGISKFINEGGYFPNSIIINFNTGKGLEFEANSRATHSSSRFGTLKIPNAYAIAYIIDGQHRLYGYADSNYRDSNTIPVVAFYELSSDAQLNMFMDINQNQKAVSPTLRLTLEEDMYWGSDRADFRLKALRSAIISKLSVPVNGPLHNKISIGEDKAVLSAKPFAEALGKSGLFPSAKGNRYVQDGIEASLYDVHNHNHSEEMDRALAYIVEFLNICYGYVEEHFPSLYANSEFIVSNRGTFAFISLIGSLNRFQADQKNVRVSTAPKERFLAIEHHLEAALQRLLNISAQDRNLLLGKLGAGAGILWLRQYQTYVYEKCPEYNPSELIDWRERQDESLQETGRQLGEEVEKEIKTRVIAKLQQLYGDNWDLEIASIKRGCEKRASEEIERQYKEGLGRPEIDWTEMFFISDYKDIIEKNWTKRPQSELQGFTTFEQDFAIDVGRGFQSKSEKTKWIMMFNSYRNLWAHKGTREKRLNKEEIEFLGVIHQRLVSRKLQG